MVKFTAEEIESTDHLVVALIVDTELELKSDTVECSDRDNQLYQVTDLRKLRS